jgi:hypothetical protein
MLTDQQMTTLAAAIRASADAGVIAALAIRNDVLLTNWCNSAGTFVVWKTSLTAQQMHSAYVWTELDTLSQSKFNQLTLMLSQGSVDPSQANIRQGFTDIFAGGATTGTRTALIALAKRFATQAEKMFATGTGTNAAPGALVLDGNVGLTEVSTALNRNP